jgi:autotransporter-associated beta strand protein
MLAVLALLLSAFCSSALAANWAWATNAVTANFSGVNWTSGTIPGTGAGTPASLDSLFFGISTNTALNNDDSAFTFTNLTFNAGASAFTLTNNSISLGGDITDNSTNQETVNLPIALLTSRNVNVTNGGSLLLGGTVSGSALGLTKLGAGTLTLTNLNTYTGATVVNAGNLVEDFSSQPTPTNILFASSAWTLGGGTITLKGKSGATTSQTNNGTTTFTANTASAIVANQNGATALNLTLAGLTRGAGSTLDVTLPTTGAVKTTNTTNIGNNKINGNGIAYSTVSGGTTWLTNSAVSPATLAALPTAGYSVDTFAASTDADIQNSDSPVAFTNNTLRFNMASKTLTLNSSGVSQITGGGILVTPTGTGSIITGSGNAALQAGATGKEIVVHDYATLTISATITNNAGGASTLTIGGTGTTTLSSTNQHTGGTIITKGVTKIGAPTGVAGPLGATNATLSMGLGGTLDLNGFNTAIGTFNATAGSLITNSSGTAATFSIGNGNNRISGMNGGTTFAGNLNLTITGVNGTRDDFAIANGVPNTHTGGTTWLANNLTDRIVNPAVFGYGPVTFGGSGGFTIPSAGLTGWNNNFTNAVVVNGSGNVWNFQNNSSGNLVYSTGPWTGSGTLTINNSFTPTFNWAGDISAFAGTFILQGGGESFSISYTNSSNIGGSALATFDLQSLTAGTENLQYAGASTNPVIRLGDLNTAGNTGSGALTLRNATATATVIYEIGALNASSTFSGNIQNNVGAVGITKVGTGVWNLTGTTLSYTGPTTVSNGVLLANGNLSGGGAVTVFGPGGFGGSGTISGAVTFTNNAVYTNGTGTMLSCAGGLTLNTGNILNFGLGTASDSIAVSGAFANNATTTPVTINIKNLTGFAPATTYTLITGGSIANTNNFVLGSVPPGYSGVLQSDGANLQVTISLSALSTAWWRGSANGSWTNTSPYNWNTGQSSGINASNYPSQPTDVHFSANSAANLNTTLGQDFTINTLTFDTSASASIGGVNALIVNTGITNSSAAGNNVISNASVVLGLDQTWENSANVLTVSAAVSGSRALTTVGNLVLSGNNSYGATTIASGTVQIGAGAASGSLGSGNVTNNGNLRINRTGSTTVSGVISGTGTFTNAGSGTVVLNSANSYSGNTAINAGTVQLGVANAIPSGAGFGDILVNGTLDLNTRSQILNVLTGSGIIDTVAGGSPTLILGTNDTSSSFSGVIKNTLGTLAVTKIGAGTAVLSGANTYSGNTTVSAGTLQLNGGSAMSSASILSLNNGTTLALHADADATFSPASIANSNLSSSAADTPNFNIDVNNVTAGASKTMTLNGALTFAPTTQGNYGADQVTVNVTGGNGYTLALGTVTSQNNGTGGGMDIFDVASGLKLTITNFTFAGGYTGGLQFQDSGSVTVGDLVQPSNRNLPINLNGPGTVTITGNAQHLASNAAATDNFNLNGGQLNINNAKALRGDNAGNTFTSILTIAGGNLDNTSGNAVVMANPINQIWNADFTFYGSSDLNMNTGPVTLGGSRTVTVNAGTLTIGGIVTDNGNGYSLTKNGNGALMFSGVMTNTGGTTLNAGTLGVSSAQIGAGSFTTADSTTLQVTVSGTNQLSPSTFALGGGSGAALGFVGISSTTVAPVNAGSLSVNGAVVVNITSGNFATGQTYPLVAYGSETISGSVALGSLPTGIGASLTDNGIGSIYLTVTNVSPEIWKGAVNGTWSIGGPLNWSFASLTTNYFDGSTVLFNDTATGTTAITNIASVSPGSITVSNSAKLYSFAGGAIGGSDSLTKDGNGTLILANTNTYSGGTVIKAGTLQLGDGAANGGAVAGNITDNGNLVFNTLADQTFAGIISGSGSVTKTNVNTLTLSSANSFTNGLIVKSGKAATDNGTGFGDTNNFITLGDASNGADVALEIGPSWTYSATPITVAGSGARTLRGTHDNSGQVQSYGNITLNSADIRFQQTGASPQRYQTANGITGTGNIIATNLGSGGTDFRSVINNTGWIRNDSTGTGGIAEGNPSFGVPGGFGPNVTSLIQNSAPAVFNLTTPNLSFLGSAQVLVGTMIASYPTALNSNNVVSVASGTTFDVQNVDLTIAGLSDISGYGGTVNDTTGSSVHTLTLGGSGNYSFSGAITAATPVNRALTVNLTGGSQKLSGACTYTGNTTISAGTLLVNGSLDAGSAVTANGGTLGGTGTINGATTVNAGATLFAGNNGSGTLHFGSNLTLDAGSTNDFVVTSGGGVSNKVAVAGQLSPNGSVVHIASGTALALGTYTNLFTYGSTNGTLFSATPVFDVAPAGIPSIVDDGAGHINLVVGSSVNTSPTNIIATVSGNVLTLSWPADHTGWRLLVQTNNLVAGISANTNDWTAVPGSAGINQTNIIMNPARPSEFYRLVYP